MIRFLAAITLAVEIAIHVKLAPDHLHEVRYIGAGFVVASVLLAVALVGVLLDSRTGWRLGVLLSLGMAASFVASRTVGLPGLHESWSSDGGLGLVALAAEAGFLGCAAAARHRAGRALPARSWPAAHW
jgi:hypothetical protein